MSDCELSWRTAMTPIAVLHFLLFAFYTTYYYWNDNVITAIQPYAIVANKYRNRAIALFAGENIYENRQPSTGYDWKCDQLATELFFRTFLSTMLTLLSHLLIIVGPIYVFIFKGEYATPSGISLIMPFMDPNSRISFFINMSIQFAAGAVSFIDTVGLEAVNCFIVNSFTTMADLVCFNMRTFSDALHSGHFSLHQKIELRRIIVQLQDLEDYINELNDLFYWRTLTLPILSTWCASLGIFSQMIVSCRVLSVSRFSTN